MNFAKKIRLLPVVMIAGTALLGVKGFGLVHGAMAQTAATQVASNNVSDGISAPKDIASDDNESSSSAEADVLTSLAKRRAELDARARDLQMRDNILQATEKRVDAKIATLKQLQAQMTTLLGQRDAAQEKQVASLVKTYSSMKPKDAARIFDGLADDVLVPVAQSMKSDALAPVLAAMNPSNAQKLTVKLASRLSLPETATASAMPTPPSAIPAPLPSIAPPAATAPADASKAPGQQAQATPPAAQPQAAAPQAPAAAGPRG